MPTYTIETARGRKLKIESDSPEEATRLADTWDLEDHASSEATRMGLNPNTALRQMRQESGSQTGRTSPKGARGPMQLMPGTARELGVDPDDPYANITGGLTYYKKQLDANGGDERRALAAYNAGPGAVARAGGVPNYPETVNYVNAIMGPDGAPVARPKPPPLPGQPGAVPVTQRAAVARAPNPNAMPKADVAGEAWSGFTQPFRDLGAGFTESVADKRRILANPGAAMPKNPMDFLKDQFEGIKNSADIPLGVLGLLSAPVQAGVRPLAAAGARAGLQPTVGGGFTFKDGKITTKPRRQVSGREAQAVIEGDINTALSGARPAAPAAPPRLSVKDPEALVTALQKAKTAAYDRVKALGGVYDGKSAAQLRQTITTDLLAEGLDSAAHPGAFSVVKRLDEVMTGKQPITLDELDKLRQVAWRNAAGLKGPDKGAERYFGGKVIDAIDDFIEKVSPRQTLNGNPADLNAAMKEARAANQRYRNTQLVANKVDSAELRASTTYAGGNKANAVRQNMRPLVDRTSAQRMRGLTKTQEKAMRQVATGTPAANAARLVGKVTDPRGLLGMGFQAALQTMLGPASGGLSGIALPLGAFASEASNAATMASVKKLLDMFANGPKPGVSAAPRIAGPYAPLTLPSRVGGTGALIAPLPQAQRPNAKTKATVRR